MKPPLAFTRVATVTALCGTLLLTSCSFLEPTPTVTPSPTPIVVDTTKYIGGVIDPINTVWSGKDDGGDLTTLKLHANGTVEVSYGDNSYDYAGDLWDVRDQVLHVSVYLDETNGTAYYTGTWNAETGAIDATMRTSRTAKQLTVTLVRE